jgi:hypothetical protein
MLVLQLSTVSIAKATYSARFVDIRRSTPDVWTDTATLGRALASADVSRHLLEITTSQDIGSRVNETKASCSVLKLMLAPDRDII